MDPLRLSLIRFFQEGRQQPLGPPLQDTNEETVKEPADNPTNATAQTPTQDLVQDRSPTNDVLADPTKTPSKSSAVDLQLVDASSISVANIPEGEKALRFEVSESGPALEKALSEEWVRDFAAACATLNETPKSLQRPRAHAKMIHGSYGINAPQPCGKCREMKRACRTYHPNMGYHVRAVHGGVKFVSNSCGWCRYDGGGCDFV
jgi:hypothetical protein